MLEFDPQDPFPLLNEIDFRYGAAQAHAAKTDAWLGLRIEEIESRIQASEGHQLWAGLGAQKLLTPYVEIRMILAALAPEPGEVLVDLGAAYGRIGFVLERHHAGVSFVGYELAEERTAEGNRGFRQHGCKSSRIETADLSAPGFQPVDADYYFIYDYGTRRAIDKTLEDLRGVASRRKIVVIGRGRSSRDAIEHGQPWLASVVAPDHHAQFSIYRSR